MFFHRIQGPPPPANEDFDRERTPESFHLVSQSGHMKPLHTAGRNGEKNSFLRIEISEATNHSHFANSWLR